MPLTARKWGISLRTAASPRSVAQTLPPHRETESRQTPPSAGQLRRNNSRHFSLRPKVSRYLSWRRRDPRQTDKNCTPCSPHLRQPNILLLGVSREGPVQHRSVAARSARKEQRHGERIPEPHPAYSSPLRPSPGVQGVPRRRLALRGDY